jgi:hypothetical protein
MKNALTHSFGFLVAVSFCISSQTAVAQTFTTPAAAVTAASATDVNLDHVDVSQYPDIAADCMKQINKTIMANRALRDQALLAGQRSLQASMLTVLQQTNEASTIGFCQIDLQKRAQAQAGIITTQADLDRLRQAAIANSHMVQVEGQLYFQQNR